MYDMQGTKYIILQAIVKSRIDHSSWSLPAACVERSEMCVIRAFAHRTKYNQGGLKLSGFLKSEDASLLRITWLLVALRDK